MVKKTPELGSRGPVKKTAAVEASSVALGDERPRRRSAPKEAMIHRAAREVAESLQGTWAPLPMPSVPARKVSAEPLSWGFGEHHPIVQKMLDATIREPSVARAVALKYLRDKEHVPALDAVERMLSHRDAYVRVTALDVYRKLPGASASVIGRLLEDPSKVNRALAIKAYGRHPDGDPARIAPFLKEPLGLTTRIAMEVYPGMKGADPDLLAGLAADEDPEVRSEALLFYRYFPDADKSVVAEGFRDPNPFARKHALYSFGFITRRGGFSRADFERVEHRLADENPAVANAARHVLWEKCRP